MTNPIEPLPAMHQSAGAAASGPSTSFTPVVLLLVGPPGSGKSTFAGDLMCRVPGHWERINQVCCMSSSAWALMMLAPIGAPRRSYEPGFIAVKYQCQGLRMRAVRLAWYLVISAAMKHCFTSGAVISSYNLAYEAIEIFSRFSGSGQHSRARQEGLPPTVRGGGSQSACGRQGLPDRPLQL